MKRLGLHTFCLIACAFYLGTGYGQLGWDFVHGLSDGTVMTVNAVKCDTSNDVVYVGGQFNSDLSGDFPAGTNGTPNFSTNNGGQDGFVAKYLTDGTFQWAFMVGGAGTDAVMDIDVDAVGNIYITGCFEGPAEFRGTETASFPNVTAFGGLDIFQAKYNSDGQFVWLHEDGGAAADIGTDVSVDGAMVVFAANYVVSGYTEIGGINPINYGGQDVCLVGRDLLGSTLWFVDGGSNLNDEVSGMKAIGDSVYLATNFTGTSFTYTDNGLNATVAQPNTQSGTNDIAIVAMALNTGLFSWVNYIQGTEDELAHDLISDGSELVLTGSFSQNLTVPGLVTAVSTSGYSVFTTSLDAISGQGNWQAVEQTLGLSDARGKSVTYDDSGNVFIAAEFAGTLNVNGAISVVSAGGDDFISISYDAGGGYLGHYLGSSSASIEVNHVDSDGSEFFYAGSVSADYDFGSISNTLEGIEDGYLAKLGICDASFSYASANFCQGNPNELAIITGDTAGNFSEASGNIVFTNSLTGEVDLTTSNVGGPYNIIYVAPGGCASSFSLTIDNNANPVFTSCPTTIIINSDPGLCSGVVNYTVPSATDDCGAATVTQTDGSGLSTGMTFPVGSTGIEYTATDLASNTSLCTFDVMVNDTEPPVITCRGDTVTCDSVIIYTAPVFSDNCSATMAQIDGTGYTSGSVFPIGVTVQTYEVSDPSGNTAQCSFYVDRHPSLNPYWESIPSSLCDDADTIDLTATVNGSMGGTFSGAGVISGMFVPELAGTGTHSITYTLTGGGCIQDSSQMITIFASPTVDAGLDDSICGLNYTLTGSASSPLQWSGSSSSFADSSNGATGVTSHVYGWNQFVITATTVDGCVKTDSVQVRFDVEPHVNAGPDQELILGEEGFLDAQPTSGLWSIIEGNVIIDAPGSSTSPFVASSPGQVVLAWSIDAGTCGVVQDTINLTVIDLLIPQGISPNADGLNDQFEISGIEYFTDRKVKFYDRWGKLIYTSDFYQNDWDGTSPDGATLPEDTYFYELKLDEIERSGFFMIKP